MKRSLFCAFALVAIAAHSAVAVVNVQLNLRYTDPADESAGGTWELLAGSDGGGISGLTALLDNVNNDATAAGSTGYEVFRTQQIGSVLEVVTGSDLNAPLDTDVGLGAGTTGNVVDDLFGPGSSPAIWENNALLATGTFGSTRPSLLATSGSLDAGANEFSGSDAVAATVANWTVRGDGVATDGLLAGDANRSGTVDSADLALLLTAFNDNGAGWDDGNFNSVDGTNSADLALLLTNFNLSSTAPAITAVPEPASLLLGMLAIGSVSLFRRR